MLQPEQRRPPAVPAPVAPAPVAELTPVPEPVAVAPPPVEQPYQPPQYEQVQHSACHRNSMSANPFQRIMMPPVLQCCYCTSNPDSHDPNVVPRQAPQYWPEEPSHHEPEHTGPLAGPNVMNVVFVGAECAPWSKTGLRPPPQLPCQCL